MARYGCGFFLLFLFLSFSSGSCLSSTQNSTMITISELLNITNSPWDVSVQPNPCLWGGVTCSNDSSSVISLSLSRFRVSSSGFLSEVCKIESLQSLDVSINRLSSIPSEFIDSCGKIVGLKSLNFSRNQLSGVLPGFVGFAGLESLDLSSNSLVGNIGSQLNGLLSLKKLNLNFNNFTGSAHLANFTQLEEFELSGNSFQGEILQQLSSNQNLRVINLGANKLSGSIPVSIGNLTKLELLILSANNFSGEIPPTIADITTLRRFAANQNGFHGKVPNGITNYLTNLDLSYNRLTGAIPGDLLSQPSLQTVDLSYNMLVGPIPGNLSHNLVRLRLGSNFLNGPIPSSFSFKPKLTYLELDNNTLSGEIPVELCSCRNLALLNLAQNKFSGSLPVELNNITNLQVLKLQFNKFNGEIPLSISQLNNLSVLNISWNGLTGSIPSSFSNLHNLSHLDLQGNRLGGSIPESIKGLDKLIELQLGQNQLGGTIPVMPLGLQIALNLSSNLFGGNIPQSFSQLKDLEILDLSNNKFSGEVPDFLTSLSSLTQLILSNNRLTGTLPNFQWWVAVNASGNPGLINATKASPPEQTKRRKSAAFAVIIAVVVAVFTLGVIGIVLFTFSRRFPKVNDHQSQSGEDLQPQVIQGNLVTSNAIHRSNIDFNKAMEAVSYQWNIATKTRFSTYYKATMPSGASYFVKKINWSEKILQLGGQDKFHQELEVLGKLSNSNVMTPLAYVLSADSAYLFYEHAQKGTLFDALHGRALDWASRYSIAVGVAQGLTFLHGHSAGPILLLDLSSTNIFLKSLKEPLVGDIELYKVIDPSKSTGSFSTVAGSVGYIPPEYAYTMRVTMAGNVYSFGVLLLELLTGKPAVWEGTELAKWVMNNSAKQDRWDEILDFSVSSTSVAVRGQMLAILKTAISCVSVSPEARPKMKTVLRMILNAR